MNGPRRLGFDDLFASSGLFGVEIGAEAVALRGQRVALRGFMSPPQEEDAGYFILSRSPLQQCPLCRHEASWPDDIAVVHLRDPSLAGTIAAEHAPCEVEAEGTLELDYAAGPAAGLSSSVRLIDSTLSAFSQPR